MGTRGPAPKPKGQRARHEAKARKETDEVVLPHDVQPKPRKGWRTEVVQWYRALGHVERAPSDWQTALIAGDLLESCYAGDFPAAKTAVFEKMQTALGGTAADRRRNGVETKAAGADKPTAAVTRLHALRAAK